MARSISVFSGLLASVLLLAAIPGCRPAEEAGSSGPAAAPGEKRYKIAVIPKGTTHEFWKSVHAGAEQAAKEFGNVDIEWKGSQTENDRDGQITVVQNFTVKKMDGICLAPLDERALVPYVAEAKQAGIPTVIFDSGLEDQSNIVSYIATDNYKGGVLAGQTLGKAMGGKGGVILLRYNVGSESTHQREEGFLETLKKEFPEIKILSSDEYSDTTPEGSRDKCQQLFAKFRDDVQGCFAVCEPNGDGMLRALEDAGLAGKVKFVGFDPSPRLIQAMEEGKMHGIVLQDPVKMGYLSVKTIMEHIQGKTVEARISTGEYVATPENMKEPDMEKLLKPQQFGE